MGQLQKISDALTSTVASWSSAMARSGVGHDQTADTVILEAESGL